jgi:hypothetical protein
LGNRSLRTAIGLAPPLILISIGAASSDETLSALVNVAAIIYLAVFALEAVSRQHWLANAIAAQRRELAEQRSTINSQQSDISSRHDELKELRKKLRKLEASESRRTVTGTDTPLSTRLLKVLTFVGRSTALIAGDSRTRNPLVLNGWLDLLSGRLTQATEISAGAMVVREEFTIDDVELEPFCEIRYAGGANQCTLPVGSRLPIRAGVAWDIAQGVGARSIYLAPIALNDQRYWICVTFVAEIDHPLLQSLSQIAVAPITLALQNLEGGPISATNPRTAQA